MEISSALIDAAEVDESSSLPAKILYVLRKRIIIKTQADELKITDEYEPVSVHANITEGERAAKLLAAELADTYHYSDLGIDLVTIRNAVDKNVGNISVVYRGEHKSDIISAFVTKSLGQNHFLHNVLLANLSTPQVQELPTNIGQWIKEDIYKQLDETAKEYYISNLFASLVSLDKQSVVVDE